MVVADPQTFERMKEDARRDDWHLRFVGSDIRQLLGEIERLRAELADLRTIDLEANRLWRCLNGHDIDDFDKRAEMIMQSSLDGLHIGPTNRNTVKALLAEHFEQIDKDARSVKNGMEAKP